MNIRQSILKVSHFLFWLIIFTARVIQSIIAVIAVNQQQDLLRFPNAEEDSPEWSDWHIDLTGKKYFNIYFSNITSVFMKYSTIQNYGSPDALSNIQQWYLQEKGCKEIKSNSSEWTGYCSKSNLPPLKALMIFPYQGVDVTNNGFPKNGGVSIKITTKLSVGIQALLSQTERVPK